MRYVCIILFLCTALSVAQTKNYEKLKLKDTDITIPWKDFRHLIDQLVETDTLKRTDTLYAPLDYLISSCKISMNVIDKHSA